MKRKVRIPAVIAGAVCAAALLCCGCSGSGSSEGTTAFVPGMPGQVNQNPTTTFTPGTATPGTTTNSSNSFVGNWVHTYEYFGNTYRTTLVIDSSGSAMYYNEEAELGNFSGSWSTNGNTLVINRSDGVVSQCVVNGNILTEYSTEDGQTYTAEYQRA